MSDETPTFFARIRQVGDSGKKQWEQVFSRANELRDQIKKDLFPRAQARGTDLLVKLLSRVREGAGALEKSLQPAEPSKAA